jgi:Zn-dependent M28 family amino/carboxypeptidase
MDSVVSVRLKPCATGALSLALLGLSLAPPQSTFAQGPPPLPGLVEDATRLDQPSAEARFDALTALLDERGLTYEIQAFPNPRADEVGPAEGRNVIVTIGDGDRDIIVGAHADAAILRDGSLSHAMVDNAAAVVVLTRVAASLEERDLRHRVRLVFFDLEELRLLGSAHYVGTLDRLERDAVAAMVNLDITGYGDTVIYGPAGGDGNEAVYAAVRQACADGGHACLEFDEFPQSDDRSFQAAGIPNVSLGTLPRVEAHQMWLLLNAGRDSGLSERFAPPIFGTIHTPNDTADKLDAAGMTLAYEMLLGLVLELDRRQP